MKSFTTFFEEHLIEKTTECSSEEGITLAMIEGIIAQLRLLKRRKLSSKAVRDALQDLRDNSPIRDFIKEYYLGPDIPNPAGKGTSLPVFDAQMGTKRPKKNTINTNARKNSWPRGRSEEGSSEQDPGPKPPQSKV